MPKRKREDNNGQASKNRGGGTIERRKREVEEKLVHGKKMLNRALKTAKAFEWQKLVKRIGNAKEKGEHAKEEVARLERELKVLKDLEMQALADAHVHKTLLKSKTIAESGLLPDYVKPQSRKASSSEDVLALDNVTARLYNTKPVKEQMSHIMASVYAVTGIPNPANKDNLLWKGREKKPLATEVKIYEKDTSATGKIDEPEKEKEKEIEGVGQAWDGFDSGSDSDGESIDFSKYEGRLGGSSDDDSEDYGSNELWRPVKRTAKKFITSRGLSVSVSGSDGEDKQDETAEEGDNNTIERSASPLMPTKTRIREPPKPLKPGSQFLPTLMGGYWSGSDESAVDVEDEPVPPPRKNRPGQQARRAIWEKKFGAKANHVKNAAPSKNRGVVWDPKLGAVVSGETSVRGRSGRPGFARSRARVTGENAAELGPRKPRGLGRKDDTGTLHPSWQAAKKAKEEKKAVKFEGKKVVF